MPLRLSALAAATAAAALIAAPAFARTSTVPYLVTVTITNSACTLDHPVAPQRFILFHVISNGTYSHQFKIYGLSSGIIKAGQEGRFGVKFHGAGAYTYRCYNSDAFLKRGVFRIR
jgi:prepilin signal peptidase PulO-like enzyme (type II secretory pathway)